MVIAICVFGGLRLFGGGSETSQPVYEQPAFTEEATEAYGILPVFTPTRPARPTPTKAVSQSKPPAPAVGDQSWLVMLYQDADDKILEQDIFVDLNEAEKVGSDNRLTIVAQLDRYRAGFQGDGDWVSAKRFYVTQDDDLGRVNSEQVADLGEVNMADAETLIDFVTWAVILTRPTAMP